MISFDTNVLFAAWKRDDPNHRAAAGLIGSFADSSEVMLAEQSLLELYVLMRNPVVNAKPLTAAEAVQAIRRIRSNPRWAVVDVPLDGKVMSVVWARAESRQFAARRIFDVRLAETLKFFGVDTFYTRNIKDFRDCGFKRLINPFEVKGKK